MYHRGQGSFEYLLLLGGTVLVATVVTVMAQGSVAGANNVFNESTNDYSSYIQGGVNDVLTNNTLVHEQPSGCMYGNPACDAGYFCDNGVCKKMNAALIGYVFDTSGAPLSGAIIHLPSGIGPDATTDAAGYYAVSASANQSTGMYSVVASKSPANVQSSATVNLTVGYASMQNFSLGYNPAVLSGYIRDYASAGISGAAVTCAGYSATTAGDGSYSFSGIAMTSASATCTLSASKSPSYFSGSASATLNAGVSSSQNLSLLSTSSSVSGYVRDASSAGVSGASVSCGGASSTTAGDGSYTISGIAMTVSTGTCTLAASKSGYTSASATVSLTAGATTTGQNLAINAIVNGACGAASGSNFYSVPTSGFCSAGTASAVSGSGPWSWTCAGAYGGSTASCSANRAVNGVCGAANGNVRSSTPSGTDLCSAGTSSALSGSNPWSWSCIGLNGGTSVSCATRAGTLNYVYFTSSTTWTVPSGVTSVDVYVLGGGGGGGDAGCGGGGGYTTNVFGYAVTPGQGVSVTVGAGGANGQEAYGYFGADGGTSAFGSVYASGGSGCHQSGNRGNGGSGGGGQCGNAAGGTDGGSGSGSSKPGGSGQGSSTRPFLSSSFAPLGAGGGGTSCRDGVSSHTDGGYSGGGHGCSNDYCTGSSGAANTGGGGGSMDGFGQRTGAGGSGIVIVRYYG